MRLNRVLIILLFTALAFTGQASTLQIPTIKFDYHKASIKPEEIQTLDKLVQIMNEYPTMQIEVTGHCDCREHSKRLSLRRAKAVIAYAIAKGIARQRMQPLAYGATLPLNDCDCKANTDCAPQLLAANRRVEIRVMKVEII